MLDNNTRKALKAIITSKQFTAVETLANEYCDKLRMDTVVGNSEWETLKTALMQEGQVRGITNFIQAMLEEANKDE